jgi:hypothetical protein
MSVSHVVVDGSNLATEGRPLPSLAQLDDAVRAFVEQYEPKTVTVIVDASFPNRIDAAEREACEAAIDAGEIITPPAGVIGRGDAFLLEVADRAGAVVLSNDSFQEFHGQYPWLFDQGRLIGGKPVPHVGWVFMDRAPVRGPASRKAVSEAKKATRKAAARAAALEVAQGTPSRRSRRRRAAADGTQPLHEEATAAPAGAEATCTGPLAGAPVPEAAPPEPAQASAAAPSRRRRRRSGGAGATGAVSDSAGVAPYNDPLPFIEFVAAHPVGSAVQGTVERFSSHGAYVLSGDTRCYVGLKQLADPPPRSAREMLDLGGTYTFVVHAFDTPRRGVDLAMPGVVAPPEPTVELTEEPPVPAAGEPEPTTPEEEGVAPAKKVAVRKAAVKKAPARKAAVKKAPAKKAPVKKTAAVRKAPARKAAVKKAPARKAAVKKTAVKKAAAVKKAPARKAAAKKTAVVKKAAVKKAPAKKAVAKIAR